MKLLFVALFSLAEAFLHPNSNKLIFRSVDQSHSLADPSAECRDHCEGGWTYFEETHACYKNFIHATFESAEWWCNLWGGHLTSIHGHKENYFVAELARSGMPIPAGSKQGTWIGLERHDHLNWTWTDGSKVDFLLWAPGQPDNRDGVQECVQLYADPPEGIAASSQEWDDLPCHYDLRSFVCKKMPLR